MKPILLFLFLSVISFNEARAQLKMLTPASDIRQSQYIVFEYPKISEKDTVEANFAFFSGDQDISFKEIKLTLVGNKYIGTFLLPENTTAFSILIKRNSIIDNNHGVGYVFAISSNKKNFSPFLQYARFYNSRGFAAYNFLGIKEDKSKSLDVYRKCFLSEPNLKNIFIKDYLTALYTFEPNSPEFNTLFLKTFNKFKAEKRPEEDLISLMNIYLSSLSEKQYKSSYDSLYHVIAENYPTGYNAACEKAVKLDRVKNIDSVERVFSTFKKDFDGANFHTYPLNYYYDNLVMKIAGKYSSDYKKILKFYNEMSDVIGQTLYISTLADDLSQYNNMVDQADSLIRIAIAKGDSLIAYHEPIGMNKSDWGQYYQKNFLSNFYITYAKILLLKNENILALKAFRTFEDLSGNDLKNVSANSVCLKILNANRMFNEVLEQGERFILLDASSKQIVNEMGNAYKQLFQAVDTVAYKNSLIDKMKNIKYDKVKVSVVDLPSHNFILTDLAGRKIELAKLKDKIIVLDFWATWCGPCKISFPGMQRAVYRYLNDKEVVFLFVNTWENNGDIEYRKKVLGKFIRDNQYAFQVLLDEKSMIDDHYKVVSDYGVSGIPTKLVIDRKGRIRFKTVGIHSTDEETVDEISTMIEILKEEY
ncbi:hypothetical protein GCM10009120_04910 [Sphingobacterium siyangense subsp. cladoniae]|uniref:TlpA family protein disulfide reductase n=1 Tax=Sphingobacterium siyangense TaxID=459529 RepID=UPI0031F99934